MQGNDNLVCEDRSWDIILISPSEQMHAQCVQEVEIQAISALLAAAIQAAVVDHQW